jgi:tetratricopeptide (TPR) repeat protein
MWELTIVAVVAFLLLAVATGPAALPRSELSTSRVFIPVAVRIPVVAFAACFFVTAVIQLLSSHELGRSEAAISRGDTSAALDHANAARTFEPWASSPWLQLALVREVGGDLQGARQAVQEALERDESDWRIWLVSARIETKLGNLSEGRRSLAEAKRLNPRSSLFDSS